MMSSSSLRDVIGSLLTNSCISFSSDLSTRQRSTCSKNMAPRQQSFSVNIKTNGIVM